MVQNDKIRVLIFGHKEFSQLLSSVLGEFNAEAECRIVDAIIGTIDEANAHINLFNPDLVISAGSNSAYLKTALDVPVLSIEVTESDIVSALMKASKIAQNIHLITYDDHSSLVSLLNESSQLKIHHSCYETAEEAKELYQLANIEAADVVVGASLVCGLAFQDKIKSFLIYSKASCRAVLRNAIEVGTQSRQNINNQAIQQWLERESKTPILVVADGTQLLNSNQAAQAEFAMNADNQQEVVALLHSNQFNQESEGKCRLNDSEWWFHKDTVRVMNQSVEVYQFYPQTPSISQSLHSTAPAPLVYRSQVMADLIERTDLYAQSHSHVLIIGESGTGKEMIARRIYQKSQYAEGQFVAINCAAMPSELFEGELFGHVEGAFTGAKKGGKRGLLYEAQNGVLFLDEVGELSLPQQAKLLRVIQEKKYRPIGSHKEFSIQLKIIAATNRPLAQQVKEGLFRDDLYYRLNVLSLHVPSLHQRSEDIHAITSHKLQSLNFQNLQNDTLETLAKHLQPLFAAYHWPGNIRELENIIERVLVYCSKYQKLDEQTVSNLLNEIAPEMFALKAADEGGAIAKSEQDLLNSAMTQFNGNKELVAEYLGISQTTLWRRLKRINDNNQRGKQHA